MGEFLDSANQGMCGSVYMDFNPGHAVQVEVIGRVVVGGYIMLHYEYYCTIEGDNNFDKFIL